MQRQLTLPEKLLLILCGLHLVINTLWLSLNKAPILWDQAGHTRLAIYFLRFFQGTLDRPDLTFFTISSYYPPLTHLVVTPFLAVTGPSVIGAAFPISLYFTILLVGIFLLIRTLSKNDWVALLTAAFFSFFPVVYENSRSFLLDIPLLTFLVFSWYFLAKTNYLDRGKYVLLFALTTVAVLLTKWIGVVFIAIPLAFVLVERLKKGWSSKQLSQILLAGILVIVLVLPWYATNISRLLEIGELASQGEVTDPQQLFSLQNGLFYLIQILNFQLTLWPALIALGATIAYFLTPKSPYKLLLGSFFLLGYTIFTFISNKDIRYTIPLLLVLAYSCASMLVRWWKDRQFAGVILLVGSLLFLVAQFFILSFHLLPTYQRAWNLGLLGWIDYVNTGDIVVHYPQPNSTPNQEILDFLALKHRKDSIVVMVGVDQPHINPSTLDLYNTLKSYHQISLEAPYTITQFNSQTELALYLSRFDYILIPTGEVGPDAVRHKTALQQIQGYILTQRPDQFRQLKVFDSSEGDSIILFIRL